MDIVFDGPPSHESGRFVEVEDATGKSINVGEWLQRPDGYWALRIAALPPGDAPQTCPHCKLLAVMPEVCTPEINAVIEDSIEQDWALLNKGVEIGKALAAPVDAPQTCEWRGDVGNGYYNTGCEVATDYFEDAPTSTAIGWKFCPYCGKPLTLAQEEPIRPPVEGQTP